MKSGILGERRADQRGCPVKYLHATTGTHSPLVRSPIELGAGGP
jgi:hypothetical protein